MCGRYTLVDVKNLSQRFNAEELAIDLQASLNVSPGTDQPIVIELQNKRLLYMMRWGLIPQWAKDPKIGNRLINARAETAEQKPTFRNSLAQRRCVVPANGFYEWHKQPKKNQPYYFSLEKNELIAFAGIWDTWQNPVGEPLLTYSILTRGADAVVSPIHDRMPLILKPDQESQWLNSLTPFETIQQVLESNNQIPLRSGEITVPLQNLKQNSS